MKHPFRTALLMGLWLLTPLLDAPQSVAAATAVAATPGSAADDDQAKMNKFIADLMQKMTVDEKIGQLNLITVGFDVTGPVVSKDVDASIRRGAVGGVFNTFTPKAARKLQEMAVKQTRLRIPLMFGYDVIHGHRTIFPISLGLAASWDLAAIEQSARIAAEEASADGLNWVFSPMVDISRDPRWGRISESAGEDPYLGSEIGRVMVRGYQGTDLTKNNTVMACVKHFALYGAAEGGRDYNTTDMSRVRMYNEYLPPYKAAIDAGAGSVMSSFNDINGVPATGNKWLMTDLLRKQWGFPGFVVTDYTAINEMTAHGMGDDAQVSALALNAGIDQDMVGEIFLKNLARNLKDGTVQQADIDTACRRILEAKWKLGLFEDPYRYTDEKRAKQTMMKPEYVAAARDIARKSLVLLKNQGQTLPLRSTGTIALIGPLASRQRDMIGSWSGAGDWKQAVSLEQGIRNVAGSSVKIVTAQGANFIDDAQMIARLNAHGGELNVDPRSADEMIAEAVKAAQSADVIVAAVGESQGMTGEAASRADIGLPAPQMALLKALKKTGKPLVIVLMAGRPLTLPWEQQNADAILETWFAGSQAGNAIADVLFGRYNPSGKLPATFPESVGQIPLYYNHKSTGRPYAGVALDKYKSRYLDVSNDPLYPFGFGLSYTTFKYGKPELSTTSLASGAMLDVKVTVQNTGNYDGEEIAQLYLRDLVGSISRPVKELKGFQKVMLKKGETRTLTFRLNPADLSFYNTDLQFVAEPGDFEVMVGGNSRDVQTAAFKLLGK
ncbi:beta-glucosidase BglX [Hymenobacter lapidiphilus]|uniref:Periplasmic beta-glucosidase n=1 Tax=Hymenobacter lapidiphilus TaxID=2608003 RepID=A0A7Y7PQ46_9BACT|nr:beta-glucosidase BglX [Hymenobacter lapidiphilus]NVO31712.1 beta-glucosidase BglX [Hymenobacter lapidiphilus]